MTDFRYGISFSLASYELCLSAFIATAEAILRAYMDASIRALTPHYYPEGW